MKKLLCGILSIVLMLGLVAMPVGAEESLSEGDIFVEGDFRCKIVNDAVSIVKYIGAFGEDVEVVIPETIQGYTVKYIGARAFYDYDHMLKSVTLPETVEAIGRYAFHLNMRCQTRLNLPVNLKYLDDEAIRCIEMEIICPVDEYGNRHIPWNLAYVGQEALFVNYPVRISENLQWVSDFTTLTGRVIAPVGSYAQAYAKKRGEDFFQDPYKPYITGDIDHSCSVDVADIMALKADIIVENYRDALTSDLDDDGEVTVGDILELKSVIMNQTKLNHHNVWKLFDEISDYTIY